MADKEKVQVSENRPPAWIIWMWVIFFLWGALYLIFYGFSDLTLWLGGGEPDKIQWQFLNK